MNDSYLVPADYGEGFYEDRRSKFIGEIFPVETPEEAIAFTGHAVGGVCPFALPEGIPVYLDRSLRRFDTVFPAAGSSNSAVSLTPDELFSASRAADWVDVCSGWEEAAGA